MKRENCAVELSVQRHFVYQSLLTYEEIRRLLNASKQTSGGECFLLRSLTFGVHTNLRDFGTMFAFALGARRTLF